VVGRVTVSEFPTGVGVVEVMVQSIRFVDLNNEKPEALVGHFNMKPVLTGAMFKVGGVTAFGVAPKSEYSTLTGGTPTSVVQVSKPTTMVGGKSEEIASPHWTQATPSALPYDEILVPTLFSRNQIFVRP
jgi:hypothetical protein